VPARPTRTPSGGEVRSASICSSMSGDIGDDAVDPAEHVRGQEMVMVGDMPVERSAQLISQFYCCFTSIGVALEYGSTADQGRTGREDSSSRLWRRARALGTHAKGAHQLGTVRWACVRQGNAS
jgi:hypothetical protein